MNIWKELAKLDDLESAASVLVRILPVRTLCISRFLFRENVLDFLAIAANRSLPCPLPERRRIEAAPSKPPFHELPAKDAFFRGIISDLPDVFARLFPDDWVGEVSVQTIHVDPDEIVFLLCELVPLRNDRSDEWAELYRPMFEDSAAALVPVLDREAKVQKFKQQYEALEAEKMAALVRLGRRDVVDTVIGSETGLRSVVERVELVAGQDVPILILGEVGTGKELIARAVHKRSVRSAKPFHRMNCGAIPAGEIESYLFGQESESPEGGRECRQGWLEKADGGTLFLDEIGELSVPVQKRLLRLFSEGRFERNGSERKHASNIRLIAATSRELERLVTETAFLEELWYVFSGFLIRIPPLRERVSDIAALAEHFARRAATRFGLSLVLPTETDIALLCDYSWPGNIRELGTVIDRAAILGNGKSLPIDVALGKLPASSGKSVDWNSPDLNLDAVLKEHLEAVLRLTKGRIEGVYGAAGLLGVNPNTLRGKMKKFAIRPQDFRG